MVKAKAIAQAAIDKAVKAEAREKKATEQRDACLVEARQITTDRDHAAKGEADCKTRNIKLESDVATFIVENTLLEASLKKVKTQRWMLFGAGLVIGLVAGVGGTMWVAK